MASEILTKYRIEFHSSYSRTVPKVSIQMTQLKISLSEELCFYIENVKYSREQGFSTGFLFQKPTNLSE